MKTLSILLIVLLCSGSAIFGYKAETRARCPDRFQKTIEGIPLEYLGQIYNAALEYGIPLNILGGLAYAESSFRPWIISRDGHDRGMFQFRDKYDAERGIMNPFDVAESASHAARLLRRHYDILGSWELAIAAHRQGLHGVIVNGPDMWYVDRVMEGMNGRN